jgi:DNA polymerase I
MKRYLYDIETDGLLDTVTTTWCIVIQDLDSRVVWTYRPDEIQQALVKLDEADYLSGHNIIAYDNRVLKKLYNWAPRPEVIIFDTLAACRTIWPHISECDVTFRAQLKRKGYTMPSYLFTGPHSLKSWSFRISGGDPSRSKFHYDDWTHFTEEMLVYCIQDVAVNCDLWDYIMKKKFSEQALSLEMKAHYWFLQMEEIGMPMDVKAVAELYATLEATRLGIRDQLVEVVPHTVIVMKTKTKQIPFNPGSRKQISKFLIDNGWKPTKFTMGKDRVVTTNPAVDEETLEEAAELLGEKIPEVKLLFEYLILSKRIGQIATGKQAWLKMAKDGIIHGRTNHMGCVTSRVSHQYPNMGQIPKAKKDKEGNYLPYWGPEYRRMFYAPIGYSMVGADASGLELRCLGHYMAYYDGGKYAKEVVEGDVHTTNQVAAGLSTRDDAKTFILK